MNSILKKKKYTKDQDTNSENCIIPKREFFFFNKSTTRSDDNLGKNMTMIKLVWIQKGKYTNT